MTRTFSRLCGTCLALGLAAPAAADVTAAEIWESWKSTARETGQTLTSGTETMVQDTLTLGDVVLSIALPDGTVETRIPQIAMTDRSDGTVSISMAPDYDARVRMQPGAGESLDMTLSIAAPGLGTVASGDAAATTYEFSAPKMSVTLKEMVVDGMPQILEMRVALEEMTGTYHLSQGDAGAFETALAASALSMDVSGEDPEAPGATFDLRASYDAVRSTSSGAVAGLAALADPAGMMISGARFDSSYAHGGGRMSLTSNAPDEGTFTFETTTTGGDLSVALDDGELGYKGASRGLTMTASGSGLPFPQLTATAEEIGFGLTAPMTRTETPADFGLLLNLSGLTVSEALWSTVDPAGLLPRDPATLTIDLAGKARMLVDLADPEAMTGEDVPGELHALDLRNLKLSFAGAELTGSGGFVFDNSDTGTFGGFPAPDGSMELRLVGGNALLDKLVTMGLIPQDQAMAARMMLGLFAKPAGEDTLTSTIAVTPDGAISANGQRLQ